MKKFNLKKALAGEKVVTRNGKEVTQLTYFTCDARYCFFGVIDGLLLAFNSRGCTKHRCDNDYNLFMAPVMITQWINIYEDYVSSFHSKEEADDSYNHGILACIEITCEEGEGL